MAEITPVGNKPEPKALHSFQPPLVRAYIVSYTCEKVSVSVLSVILSCLVSTGQSCQTSYSLPRFFFQTKNLAKVMRTEEVCETCFLSKLLGGKLGDVSFSFFLS